MSRQSFQRDRRLLNSADFKAVFDRADIKVSGRHALILARRTDTACSRLGLVVAKKHIRSAVRRNRVKRLVREHFRQHPPSHHIDIVVLARAAADHSDNPQLRQALAAQWSQLEQQLGSL